MSIQKTIFTGAFVLLLLVPGVSYASVFSDIGDWFSGATTEVSSETQTASVGGAIPETATWLHLTANNSHNPVADVDGTEVVLHWTVDNVTGVGNCQITYPGSSGDVSLSVAVFGSKTVSVYPSKSPTHYIEFVCTKSGVLGRDIVLFASSPTPSTPPPSTTSGGHPGAGSTGVTGAGSGVIQVQVPVVNAGYGVSTGGSGGLSFRDVVNGVTNVVGSLQNGVSGVQTSVSGATNGIARAVIGERATNAVNHGLSVATNAVQTHFTQPTVNWIANNVPIVGTVMRWLGIGGTPPPGAPGPGGSSTGNPSGSPTGSSNTNRNTTGSNGSSGGGSYRVQVGPLSNGASGPSDGSNNCNGGTDNCNNNNNPYGFEQDPSKVQNTNDNR